MFGILGFDQTLQLYYLLLLFLIPHFLHMSSHIEFIFHISELVIKTLNPLLLDLIQLPLFSDFIRAFHQLDIFLTDLSLESPDLSRELAYLVFFGFEFYFQLL